MESGIVFQILMLALVVFGDELMYPYDSALGDSND
jgi:hypothetical protein